MGTAQPLATLREQGFSAHERGDLDGAQQLYREVLRRSTDDVEVMHACGIVEVQTGRYDAALQLLEPVVRRLGSATAYSDLGSALLGLTRFNEALDCYDRAVALRVDLMAAHINRGHALRGLGRLEDALLSYSRAIECDPRMVGAHLSRASVQLELGRWQGALESADTAITMGVDSAEVHTLRGLALAALGRIDEALGRYEIALARNARYVPALINRGIALRHAKRLNEAVASYSRALEAEPQSYEALCNRAVSLIELDRFEDALLDCRSASELRPEQSEPRLHRGAALAALERYEDCLTAYAEALACGADRVRAFQGRGRALLGLQRSAEALESYDRALMLRVGECKSHLGRGQSLLALERFDSALRDFEIAVVIDAGCAEAHVGAGMALAALEQWELALSSFDRAIGCDYRCRDAFVGRAAARRRLNLMEDALADCERAIVLKADAGAHCNQGSLLTELKRCDAALESFARALAIDPCHAAAHFNRSIALLLAGHLQIGWTDYEWRWQVKEKGVAPRRREFDAPRWTGAESLTGKSVLLHAEQGLGDTLQFSRYADVLAVRGARVILEVQKPLVRILGSLAGAAEVLAQRDKLPPIDYWCPLMSVPLACRTTPATLPAPESYLTSSALEVSRWQGMLGRRSQPRIGLAWSGSALHKHDHNRSLALTDLVEALPQGLQYISLQKGIRDADRVALQARPEILDTESCLTDFGATAALCDCLDLIISVDTSVAHLCGALGRPTWIVLPWYPDWRWQLERDDSPWYPSVKLYRQSTPGDWRGVIERIAADLRVRFAT